MKYRIKFSKYSSMVFIGHLDMMRYFQKAIRRAGLPIAYSTGFSPHQILSFAAPLGVGLFSNGEYADLEFTTEVKTAECKKRLQFVMVEGVDILSVKVLPKDAGNAMASVAAASYTVKIRKGHEREGFSFTKKFDHFMSQNEILIEKETKKSSKVLNLKEFIFDYKADADSIYLLVDASSSGNIKPGLVMEAYYQFLQIEPEAFEFVITREETYTRDHNGQLISLDAVGEDL
ncbi:MAG: TIGR03936 family radical SAM-associated protein [Lachnospiraceae bacterium]